MYAVAVLYEYRDLKGKNQWTYFKDKHTVVDEMAVAKGKHNALSAHGRHYFSELPGGKGWLTEKVNGPTKVMYFCY